MNQVKNVFGGLIAGIVMIVIGLILLFWNEGNNVRNIKTVNEIRNIAIDVDSKNILPENDGKLVAASGELEIISGQITDSQFGVSVISTILEREVEVYQWEEEKKTEDEENTYSYTQKWSDKVINSSSFTEKEGHTNPNRFPYEKKDIYARNVKLGNYQLSEYQIIRMNDNAVYGNLSAYRLPYGYKIVDKYITNSQDINNPKIGDVRISFTYNSSLVGSILAMQDGNYLIDYISEEGKTINKIEPSIKNAEQMINEIEKSNETLKWILRIFGTVFEIFGIAFAFVPISKMASFIPLFGGVIGKAVMLFALLAGFAISLTVIALAWLAYRPIIAISLLAAVTGLIVLIVLLVRKKK